MPTRPQDRMHGGPFAALLILLSLLMGSATAAAAGADPRGASTRLGSGRHNVAPALLPAGTRHSLEDEEPGSDSGPYVLPSAPGIVTERLWERPPAELPSGTGAEAPPPPPTASYRARAPPAR